MHNRTTPTLSLSLSLKRIKTMSASRFFLLGTTILRTQRTLLPSTPLIRQLKPFPYQTLCFGTRYQCSSSAAIDLMSADTGTDNTEQTLESRHPWPEWVIFVDRLKTKGYLTSPPLLTAAAYGESCGATTAATDTDDIYKDMNLLKDACLSFARDRFDVFRSLSRKDIQTVVEGGCPNLLRKAVNSAKRLRAYIRLDEGDVCSACNLRGSCDRAYVILKENEADARTVDIMRILLFYALDPLVILGGEKPPGREIIEVSTKKLLSELIELSETSPSPALPKPAAKAPQKKDHDANSTYEDFSQSIEMKRGDWMCPKCNFMNFSRNMQCRQCKEDGPKNAGLDDVEMKKGDWICSECTFMNFSRNIRCLKCKAEGPKRVSVNDAVMKKGDWNCPQCAFMNFASNTKCLRCREARPKRQLNPGEWECPSCDFLNYRKNMVCLKCNCARPEEAATKYEEHEWNP